MQGGTLVPLWIKRGQMAGSIFDERPVLISFETKGTFMRGQMRALTATSAQIVADDPCLLCNAVRANIRFRYEDTIYSLTGMAITNECDEIITLQFDHVTRQNMAMLRSLGATPTEPLHRPVSSSSGPRKRTKAEQRVVLHYPPPDGIERRIQPRYELETVATLVVLDKRSALKTTLLEISLSGCRLFSETPFNLPAESRVEIEFLGQGQPFRLAGEAKLKTDEHLLGIFFSAMSSRCKERLRELIKELSERKAPHKASWKG